jgi:heme-degrading monooxygenase HmoA
MYVILWEYRVTAEHRAQFEKVYSADGAWARLFRRSEGFIRTDLLRDRSHSDRYVTVDWWRSAEDYEAFLSQWGPEYAAMDARSEHLTEHEAHLGKWHTVGPGTR